MVHIADNLFGPWEGHLLGSFEKIRLVGYTDEGAALDAMNRVGERLMRCDEAGVERPADFEFSDDFCTPSYCSTPSVKDDGIELYVDCSNQIEEPMQRAFVRVVADELADPNFEDASVSNVPLDDEIDEQVPAWVIENAVEAPRSRPSPGLGSWISKFLKGE